LDWARAIAINQTALTRIVAEIFALLGLAAGGTVERLPQALYQAAERLLRPTESALRRLIVIAARGLVVKPSPKRAMPKGIKIERKAAGRISFRLFDSRKQFDFIQPQNPLLVMVKTYSSNPFNLFERYARQGHLQQAQEPAQDDSVNAISLSRRLAAVHDALNNLPRQARRMARWQARRKLVEKPKFILPLRPGRPPGHRRKPRLEIDYVLQECHGLAWDALREDSS
jgi:hypothetical protein